MSQKNPKINLKDCVNFIETCDALLEVRNKRLYQTEFNSFEEFVSSHFPSNVETVLQFLADYEKGNLL